MLRADGIRVSRSSVLRALARRCLATPVSGTTATRDAIAALRAAISEAERLLGHPLLDDCLDPETGEIELLTIVTDNGPAYKSTDFLTFIRSRPELRHVRTRHHAPETNGFVERFNQSLKYEHLYRLEIPDALALVDEAESFRRLYNEVRPHEALDFETPLSRYLAEPAEPHLSRPESVQES
jgi:transposase InsO family protein